MTYDDLVVLIDYHYWARDRTLEAVAALPEDVILRDLGNSFASIRDTLVHLYGAEWIWCARWNGDSPEALPDASRTPTFDAIRQAWHEHEPILRGTLEQFRERGVDRLVEYRRNGRTHAEPFSHQLQHLVNHGSYHRGQITTMLRQLGAQPPQSMDLIAFYRERAVT